MKGDGERGNWGSSERDVVARAAEPERWSPRGEEIELIRDAVDSKWI